MFTWVKKNKFWVFCGFLFLFLRLPTLFEPYWYGDEGIYLVLGNAIRHGWTLYSQIHDNKPPTLYLLAAIGQTVLGFRLLLLVWMVPTLYIFYRLLKIFFTDYVLRITFILFLVLTSIPLFEGTIANAEIFMLLPTIYGVYLVYLFTQEKQKNLNHLVVAGLLLGFAFTIKIPVFVEFGFLCFWILISSFSLKKIGSILKSYILLLISFSLPILFYAVYYLVKGVFNDFVFASLLQNFGYLSSWSTGSHSGGATSGGLISRAIILLLTWLVIYLFVFFKQIKSSFAFVLLWFTATVFGALLSTRPYPHYLIQILPPLILLIGLIIQENTRLVKAISLGLIFGIVAIFFKYKFYVYPVFSYYQNSYSYILHLKSYFEYQRYFSPDVPALYQTASYIKSNTLPTDKIFVWGDQPFIYALSNRLPVGKFTVAYHVIDFNQYSSIYSKLISEMPKYILDYDSSFRPYPDLHRLLSLYYYPDNQIGKAVIYRLRP
ncbi:glycosyltransferase family 39 protein [Candidatus Shapirobacteria bacterium]|nr:glycosyltransferase family 39 protein [Candidatus Shapirobacteria bacterium]